MLLYFPHDAQPDAFFCVSCIVFYDSCYRCLVASVNRNILCVWKSVVLCVSLLFRVLVS